MQEDGSLSSGNFENERTFVQRIEFKKNLSDDELIELMVAHPDLIQRPIVVKGKMAVLARPVEEWKKILEG